MTAIKRGHHDLSDVEGSLNIDTDCDLPRVVAAGDGSGDLLFNQRALQQYILFCSQECDRGGLRGLVLLHPPFTIITN